MTQTDIVQLRDVVIPGLEAEKAAIEAELSALNEKLNSVNGELNSDIPAHIAELNGRLPKLNNDLAYLRAQLPLYQKALNDAYYAANVANENVVLAQQNLDAANKRYTDESAIVKEATFNIEQARVEKDQADLAVEALLRQSADILPFSTAPISVTQISEDGTLTIDSWPEYVLNEYGPTVRPYFTGDIQMLYSFRPGGLSGNLQKDCASSSESAMSGFVIQVGDASFRMLVDGQVFNVGYNECTQGLSNIEDYSLVPGDIAVVKGQMDGSDRLEASTIATVRN